MANGNFAGGDGTLGNPFLIEDALDLNAVRNSLGKCYKMIKNIDLNISPFNLEEGWIPIGSDLTRFTGNFEGNGLKIKNLFINRPTVQCQGLFGYVQTTTIKNLSVTNINITGNTFTGGITGRMINSSMILNCSCTDGKINGVDSFVGGIAGDSVTLSTISNCYQSVEVINGIAGRLTDRCKVINCYSIGKTSTSGIANSISVDSIVTNSYWDIGISNPTTSLGGTGKSTLEMKNPATFVGWKDEKLDNGKQVWVFRNNEYPKLWFDENRKYLIQQDNQIYTMKSEFYDTTNKNFNPLTLSGGVNPNDADYKNFGFDDLNSMVGNMTCGSETFKPIDKLQDEFDILEYIE